MDKSNQLTDEQNAVVRTNAFRTRVDAGAGTGKTSTLVHFSRVRPRERGLYLALNKSVRMEAKRRFPTNCSTSTFHALAYPTHGRPYHAAGKLVPAVSPASLLNLISDRDATRRFLRVRLAMKAVHEFTVSTSVRIAPSEHLISEASKLLISTDVLISDAIRIWEAMTDITNTSVGITHDGYFKTFALTSPTAFADPFHYILVDESQDLNPVTDQVLQRVDSDLCYVGDSAQSIYAFRGARDCLRSFKADATHQLTKSFRFGQNIASVTNALLSKYADQPLQLTGLNPVDMVGELQDDLPYCTICRTNAGAFGAAADAVRAGHSIHFVGGPSAYGFTRIRQAYNLSTGNLSEVRDPFLKALGSLQLVKEYAELVQDSELRSICRVVEQHGSQIPILLSQFEKQCVQTPVASSGPIEAVYPATCFISTAHKGKGLEFPQVRLADDFPPLMRDGIVLKKEEVDPQELNLLYVAFTRAVFVLEPPRWLNPVLDLKFSGMSAPVRASIQPVTKQVSKESAPIPSKSNPQPKANSLYNF